MKTLAIGVAFILATTAMAAAQESPTRTITHVTGDLYRFQNEAHYAVFLVTPEGIIVTDPINKEAATWLKTELKRRFDRPVKYVIYSHDHADHISGGEVFADEATIVAHERARAAILGEKRPTAVPDLTFSERMTIHLGGKQVDLLYVGRNHSDNSIVMRFPAERAVFAVDFISVDRLPYRTLGDAYFPDWIESLERVERLDFDILLPGHGKMGTRADVAEHRAYLQALYDAVLNAAREGKTLEEMKRTITLEAYGHFENYDAWRELNIEGMYRHISLHRAGN